MKNEEISTYYNYTARKTHAVKECFSSPIGFRYVMYCGEKGGTKDGIDRFRCSSSVDCPTCKELLRNEGKL